jgi:hypothetical protein
MVDFSSLHAFWLEELLQGISEKLLPTHADVEAAESFDIIFYNDEVLSTGRRCEGKVLKMFLT